MTATPEELVDPGQAFLDSLNPENILEDPLGAVGDVEVASTQSHTVAAIALSLAAAFLVIRALMSSRLAAGGVPEGDVERTTKTLWQKYAPYWLRMSAPAVNHAFELGGVDLTVDDCC